MAKYFEIVYKGPFGGLHVQAPENVIPPEYSPNFNDFMLRNQELRSRPAFSRQTQIPSMPTTNGFTAIGSFGTLLGSQLNYVSWKTFGIDPTGPLYALDYSSGVYSWTLVGGNSQGSYNGPISWRSFQNVLYGASPEGGFGVFGWNGGYDSTPYVSQVAFSGSTNPPVSPQQVYGGYFIDELADHLILLSTTEYTAGAGGGQLYPYRVRWSNSGFNPYGGGTFGSNLGTSGATFDPSINTDAGFADLLEVSDQITGEMMLGTVGYIFRRQGITQMNPTGSGSAPFTFQHLWASEHGVGNLWPFTNAQYGLMGVFVAEDNVYQLSPTGFNVIGGFARDAIIADLSKASSYPCASILPGFNFGYVYLVYILMIPQTSNGVTSTVCYLYSFEDQNWMRWTLPGYAAVGRPDLCTVGPLITPTSVNSLWATEVFQEASSFDVQALSPVSSYYAMTPVIEPAGAKTLRIFDTTNFDDPLVSSAYSFRMEDVVLQRVPTIRRVVLAYHDIGKATIGVTIKGTNDDGDPVSASTTVTIGSAEATGNLLTKFVDLELTAFRPQTSINRTAGAGPLSIATVTLCGEVEEVTL